MKSMKSAVAIAVCGVIFSSSAFASQFMTLQEKADAIQQVRNEANAANDLNTILIEKYNNHRQDMTTNDYAAMTHASDVLRTAGKQIADIQAISSAPVATPSATPSKLIAPPKMMNVPNQVPVLTPVRQPQPIAQLTPPTPVHQATPALQLTPAPITQKVPVKLPQPIAQSVPPAPVHQSTPALQLTPVATPAAVPQKLQQTPVAMNVPQPQPVATPILVPQPLVAPKLIAQKTPTPHYIQVVNAPLPKPQVGVNGKDGKNGANGVTTTLTKREVDTTTINKVKTLTAQTSAQEQDLKAAKQFFVQQQASTNTQFKSLKNEVDDNKKQANAGISGAMAMAGLPQVQTNQRVMFSAGGATYNGESALAVGASVNFNDHVIGKASFSDDTANNMGASVGFGIGF